jgi:putative transcriptional regulator
MRRGRSPDACLNTNRDRLPATSTPCRSPPSRASSSIASPALLDPNFVRTVVLITEHSEEAAMGPRAQPPARRSRCGDAVPRSWPMLVDARGARVRGRARAARGGRRRSAVVTTTRTTRPSHRLRSASAYPAGGRGFPGRSARVEQHVRVFCGYAGWGAGQLEDELEQEAWDRWRRRSRRTCSPARPTSGARVAATPAAAASRDAGAHAGRPVEQLTASAGAGGGGSTDMSTPDATPPLALAAPRRLRMATLHPRGRAGRGLGDPAAERHGRQRRGRAPLAPSRASAAHPSASPCSPRWRR